MENQGGEFRTTIARFMAGRNTGVGAGALIAVLFGMLSFLFVVTGEPFSGILYGAIAVTWVGITWFIKVHSPDRNDDRD